MAPLHNESLQTLHRFAEGCEDLIFVVNKAFCIEYLNSAASTFIGAEIGEVKGKSCLDLLPTSDGKVPDRKVKISRGLKKSIEAVFKSGKPSSIECLLGKPGHEIWLHTRLTPIADAARKTAAALGIARDISEQKRLDKLIANSRCEWLQAVDSMPHFLAIVGSDFRIKKANKALAKYLGMSMDELHGRNCHQILDVKGPAESCPLRRSKTATHGPAEFVTDIRERPFVVTVSPLKDKSENVTGCLFIARDLHGHLETTEVKKRNAEELKVILSQAEYIVATQDGDGKYLSLNALPGNVQLSEAVNGKTPFDFFETATATRICARIKKTIKTGKDFTFQTQTILGGETFHLRHYISLVRDAAGNLTSVMTISKNMTNIREEPAGLPSEAKALTKREHEVLQLLGSGHTRSQIAEKLFISRKTVETHISRIVQKLGIHKASALAVYAVKSGLL